MTDPWIAERTRTFDSSGIRKVFELAGSMQSPIDLSIGQPDYDVPEPVRAACIDAIQSGKNNYALTQGMPVLREKLQHRIDEQYGHADRSVFVSLGHQWRTGLALLSLVNPGDEVIIFDPYFVMYESLTRLVGGMPVLISTYPDFQIPVDKVAACHHRQDEIDPAQQPCQSHRRDGDSRRWSSDLAELAAAARHRLDLRRDLQPILLRPSVRFAGPVQPADDRDRWFLQEPRHDWLATGFRARSAEIIDTMVKVQQYTFVCAPQPAQWAGAVAMDVDIQTQIEAYHKKRDMIVDGLSDLYEIASPNGAFYVFPKAPWGTGTEFVKKAIENNLLIIPGNVFSRQDTHFRISYAASDERLAARHRSAPQTGTARSWSSTAIRKARSETNGLQTGLHHRA